MINLPDIRDKVQKGIDWLNENHPNWVSKIDLKKFNFQNLDYCVLGQLWMFHNVKETFSYIWMEEHGFDVDANCKNDEDYNNQLCFFLNEEWKQRIEELQSKIELTYAEATRVVLQMAEMNIQKQKLSDIQTQAIRKISAWVEHGKFPDGSVNK